MLSKGLRGRFQSTMRQEAADPGASALVNQRPSCANSAWRGGGVFVGVGRHLGGVRNNEGRLRVSGMLRSFSKLVRQL